jgi:lipid II:glycine glycyltransferase (peptidoglycan interpeptide bridge formation enzyme)
MWGVYEFKRGFRGTVVRHVGAWDYAPFPLLYAAYTRLWPRLLAWMRRQRGVVIINHMSNNQDVKDA